MEKKMILLFIVFTEKKKPECCGVITRMAPQYVPKLVFLYMYVLFKAPQYVPKLVFLYMYVLFKAPQYVTWVSFFILCMYCLKLKDI